METVTSISTHSFSQYHIQENLASDDTDQKIYYFVVLREVIIGIGLALGVASLILCATLNPLFVLGLIASVALTILGMNVEINKQESSNTSGWTRKPKFLPPYELNQPLGLQNVSNNCWIIAALQLFFNCFPEKIFSEISWEGFGNSFQPLLTFRKNYCDARAKANELAISTDVEERKKIETIAKKADPQSIRTWLCDNGVYISRSSFIQEDPIAFFEYLLGSINQFLPIQQTRSMTQVEHIAENGGDHISITQREDLIFIELENELENFKEIEQLSKTLQVTKDALSKMKRTSRVLAKEDSVKNFRVEFDKALQAEEEALLEKKKQLEQSLKALKSQHEYQIFSLEERLEKYFHSTNEYGDQIDKTFIEAPDQLLIYFKRFYQINDRQTGQILCDGKIKNPIPIPTELTLKKEVNLENIDTDYQFSGFIQHLGFSLHGGHYVAGILRDGKWKLCNDSYVGPISQEKALEQAAQDGTIFLFTKKSQAIEPVDLNQ